MEMPVITPECRKSLDVLDKKILINDIIEYQYSKNIDECCRLGRFMPRDMTFNDNKSYSPISIVGNALMMQLRALESGANFLLDIFSECKEIDVLRRICWANKIYINTTRPEELCSVPYEVMMKRVIRHVNHHLPLHKQLDYRVIFDMTEKQVCVIMVMINIKLAIEEFDNGSFDGFPLFIDELDTHSSGGSE